MKERTFYNVEHRHLTQNNPDWHTYRSHLDLQSAIAIYKDLRDTLDSMFRWMDADGEFWDSANTEIRVTLTSTEPVDLFGLL